MPEDDATARPGVAPGSRRTSGTMFAVLYGELTPHAWRDPESEYDAYFLFYHRSLAMGWLEDRGVAVRKDGSERDVGAPGLWGMNDAGWGHPRAAAGTKPVSWFQVEASAVAGDRPLPVQPFLRCAHDATARAGRLDLSAVQALLPVQGLDASSRPPYAPSMSTAPWFVEHDPRSSTAVEITVSSGRDPSIPAVAERLADHLRRLEQDVFDFRSHDLAGPDAVLAPPFHDDFWNGPALHGLVLRGELTEWSCDAIGWVAEVVADSAALLGVRSPLLFTAARTGPAG
ncbi:hypothetical protein GCM10017673_39380 [Streptosporangium violaceochromogenes]|nr:hypothetical protein GCM10017673_39380 [Streptosporangium violaceochromogenes]